MPILNKLITTVLPIIPKEIVGQVAKRYIAGVALSDGVRVVNNLNQKRMMNDRNFSKVAPEIGGGCVNKSINIRWGDS